MPPEHSQNAGSIADAAQRLFSLQSAREIVVELARAAVQLTGARAAFSSFLKGDEQWSQGQHIGLDAQGGKIEIDPRLRSALYAVRRQQSPTRAAFILGASELEEPVAAALALPAGESVESVHAAPLVRSGGRVVGQVVLVNVPRDATAEGERTLEQLSSLASLAIANALKFSAARRNQERLFLFAEATDEALWDWDVETDEMWWGGGIFKLLREGSVEVGPRADWKFTRIHPDDVQRVRDSLERALNSRDSLWSEEYAFQRSNGEWVVVEDRGHFLRDANGRAFRVAGAMRDVSGLKALSDRLQTVADNATLALFLMDAKQHCTYMNSAAERMTGFTLAEARGRPLHDVVHHTRPDGSPFPLEECPIDRVLPQNVREQGEEIFIRKDGTFFPVAFTASPIMEAGTPVGTVIEVRDVTQRKRQEQQREFLVDAATILAESFEYEETLERMAQRAVPALGTACAIHLLEGNLLRRVVLARAPGPRGEAVGAEIGAFLEGGVGVIPLDSECWLAKVVRSEAPLLVDYPALGTGGNIASVPLRTPEGVLGVISLLADGVHRRFEEGDMTFLADLARTVAMSVTNSRLYHRATEAIHARDDFLSVASHELKTPLTPLHLQIHLILRRLPELAKDDEARDWLENRLRILRRQGNRLRQLVEGLLDISRIVEGGLRFEPEDLELVGLVKDVVNAFEEQGELSRARVELDIRGASAVQGSWDRMRLEQVVTNLVSNALKYGEGRPVDIQISQSAGQAVLEIRDQGIGVEPEHHERVFGRFERAVSSRNFGGLGLGLYIVRQIVEGMGGTIELESAPGQGATFRVILPLRMSAGEPSLDPSPELS